MDRTQRCSAVLWLGSAAQPLCHAPYPPRRRDAESVTYTQHKPMSVTNIHLPHIHPCTISDYMTLCMHKPTYRLGHVRMRLQEDRDVHRLQGRRTTPLTEVHDVHTIGAGRPSGQKWTHAQNSCHAFGEHIRDHLGKPCLPSLVNALRLFAPCFAIKLMVVFFPVIDLFRVERVGRGESF